MLLVFRLVLGLVFIIHGWDKVYLTGITETTGRFSAAGVPQPKISAWIAAVAELAGGGMLVVGLLATLAAGGLALLMACAFYFVHLGSEMFVADGGYEYVVVLIVALLMVVVFGPGRASIDGVLGK